MSHDLHETKHSEHDDCHCHAPDAPTHDAGHAATLGVSRGRFLRWSAAGLALPAGLALAGQPVARALAGRDASTLTYAPVPATTNEPAIPSKGYLLQQLGAGLYYLTDGIYQMMFLTTGQGVIAVDAPPTIGHKILRAIGEVTSEPVTHVVYSHLHADHIGAAVLYPHDAVRIAHTETARLLRRVNDPNRPLPTHTFHDHYTLRVGDQVLQLDYMGPNHAPGNIFIHAPRQKVLMLIDIVFPGWVPFRNLQASQDIPGWIGAHEQALTYDFQALIGGHFARLGTRQDVTIQREYVKDLFDNAREALVDVAFGPIYQAVAPRNPGNVWALYKVYLDVVTQRAADATQRKWLGKLAAVDVFTYDSAFAMMESLRIDYGVLGPFGISK
jgi:glyoxylase-like metal-dependent hydrolase (beta-lactamase superfamily II)